MRVLGISSSPRETSNSDQLLRQALSGSASAGAEAEYLRLNKLNMAPCNACGACYGSGECIIEDDFQMVLPKMLRAERIIFATPVYFMSVCSQAKILIDRCECLWARKYLLKRPIVNNAAVFRSGMVIAVGGSKVKKMFEGIRLTMKYYFDALDMGYFANLFVSSVEEAGKIEDNKRALEEAHRLGQRLVETVETKEITEIEITG
jgi:multimeric flavodoxin WrbA